MFKSSDSKRQSKPWRSYYINRFFSMKCSKDLHLLDVFPNAKEITESFGAFEGTMTHISEHDSAFHPNNPDCTVVCVGDGVTPRTACTFAFRTKWDCFSVDPLLRPFDKDVDRLTVIPNQIERVAIKCSGPVLIACVHSHARLKDCARSISGSKIAILSIPCCVPQKLDCEPDLSYRDQNIWSKENLVKIWKNYERKKRKEI